MNQTSVVIRNPEDLINLIEGHSSEIDYPGEFKLAEGFKSNERGNLEEDLNRFYYACGCGTGTAFFIVGLIVGIAYICWMVYQNQFSFWMDSSIMIALAITGLCAGKFIGLRYAKSMLNKTVEKILLTWLGGAQ